MNRPYVPQPILDAAHARSAARADHRWDEADRLRAQIEAAGWRVIDRGTSFRLEIAAPPDAIDGAVIRYGRSAAVPSRMAEPATARATLVVVASDACETLDPTIAGLRAHRGEDDQVLVIVDGPSPSLEAQLRALPMDIEVVRTAVTLGAGASLNIALRRATGTIIILVDPGVEPTGDIVPSLASALADRTVAVAGVRGRTTVDLRTYQDVATGADATVIAAGALAFRREDGLAAAPIDEAFSHPRHLDTWWSLTLRAGSPAQGVLPPRRAVVVAGAPVRFGEAASLPDPADPVSVRQAKRNFYRLLERFRDRQDLLAVEQRS
ncbi:MAG: glycosyltransferase [Chloroflexota bacterium]